jgi:hypothetical protein
MVATPIEAARSEKDPDGEGEHVQYCCFILLRRRTGDERRTGMDACTCPASPTWSLSLISSSKSSKELNGWLGEEEEEEEGEEEDLARPFYARAWRERGMEWCWGLELL